MSVPQNSFWTLARPHNQPIRAPKEQNDPKSKSKSKVRIEENIANKSCSTTWLNPNFLSSSKELLVLGLSVGQSVCLSVGLSATSFIEVLCSW